MGQAPGPRLGQRLTDSKLLQSISSLCTGPSQAPSSAAPVGLLMEETGTQGPGPCRGRADTQGSLAAGPPQAALPPLGEMGEHGRRSFQGPPALLGVGQEGMAARLLSSCDWGEADRDIIPRTSGKMMICTCSHAAPWGRGQRDHSWGWAGAATRAGAEVRDTG